MGKAARRLART